MPYRSRHGIPEKSWTPWIGPRTSEAWEFTLPNVVEGSREGWLNAADLIKAWSNIGERPLEKKTAINTIYRLIRIGVFLQSGKYDSVTGRGPLVKLNFDHPKIDSFVTRPEKKKVDKFKRQRAIDRTRVNPQSPDYDPIESKYELGG